MLIVTHEQSEPTVLEIGDHSRNLSHLFHSAIMGKAKKAA